MKKIVFCKLMLSLKRNIPIFLLYFAGYVVLSFIAVNFVTSWFIVNSPEALSVARSGDRSLLTEAVVAILSENLRVYGCVIMFFELALIWLISLRLPLQLPRALYVCPAGRTDKLRYLKFYLAVKLLFLVFVLIAIDVTGWGGIFLSLPPAVLIVQISLMFFLFLDFSLISDPGNRRDALKKCPDIVTERASSTFVSIYWFALLVLENTIFYSLLLIRPDFGWLDALWWLPALILNIILAKKHVTPALEIMLDYEKLYFPIRE